MFFELNDYFYPLLIPLNSTQMSDDFFSGKWVGEYRYGEGYPPKAPVRFEIEMTVQNGLLIGFCVDDETKHHFEKPTLIEGTLTDKQIRFHKKFPYFWDHDDKFNPRFMPKLPPRKLEYIGRFEDGKFVGEWQVSSSFTDDTGEVFEYKGSGYWEMRKA